jgi:hypothetical protein
MNTGHICILVYLTIRFDQRAAFIVFLEWHIPRLKSLLQQCRDYGSQGEEEQAEEGVRHKEVGLKRQSLRDSRTLRANSWRTRPQQPLRSRRRRGS